MNEIALNRANTEIKIGQGVKSDKSIRNYKRHRYKIMAMIFPLLPLFSLLR